jgi:hypothetical protein
LAVAAAVTLEQAAVALLQPVDRNVSPLTQVPLVGYSSRRCSADARQQPTALNQPGPCSGAAITVGVRRLTASTGALTSKLPINARKAGFRSAGRS